MSGKILKQTAVLVLQVLATALLFFCAYFFIPIAIDTIKHEQVRKNMEFELTRIKHPENSVFASSRSTVGLYAGNSNHCDYFAGQLRQFSGEQQAVVDFYQGMDVNLLFIENGVIGFKEFLNRPGDWGVTAENLQDNYYIVYKTSYFNPPGNDIRCH